MSPVTWIIIYFIIFIICCLLLGYMGKDRRIGTRRAGFIPLVTGIVTATVFLWIYSEQGFRAGSWLSDLRNVFLIPFLASLSVGYILVKLSPGIPEFMQELEKIYDKAIRYETEGNLNKAISEYREAMQKLIHKRSQLHSKETKKYDELVDKLEKKISALNEQQTL